ncbi:unnamed protein product [Durusdinium trenchii]|uniref:Uncharacterized protein n=1 Tax=Durusdinium trenchii TaxID=1381693 RepID=A0ABP0SWW9_9DINO
MVERVDKKKKYSCSADPAMVKHQRKLEKAEWDVKQFLMKNNFPQNPNGQKGKFFVTFPLHEAVKQNNPYITWALLIFGARPKTKDWWGRTAYEYGGRAVREVFQKLAISPTSPKRSGSNLIRFPPPYGWERFFARLGNDPLTVPNREELWLQELGDGALR